MVGTEPARRRTVHQRLMAHAQGMNRAMAVLTYGTYWKIYDLSLRPVRFTDKLVERLSLGLEEPDDPEEIGRALHYWLRQDLWCNRSE